MKISQRDINREYNALRDARIRVEKIERRYLDLLAQTEQINREQTYEVAALIRLLSVHSDSLEKSRKEVGQLSGWNTGDVSVKLADTQH